MKKSAVVIAALRLLVKEMLADESQPQRSWLEELRRLFRVDTFQHQFEFVYEEVPVALYRCTETGLRVAAAQEAFDDFGCPHTLEHLIFLGSEQYPFKGVLDVLANRCLAQGTNAWTATDHTCYTVDTAGAEGFLRLLPVYLDHVLFPTLKDSGFVTEVHHITGEGVDAGVVYCEMQARENEAGDMCDRAMRLAAYPGRCGYKSETGGRLKELRELTNATVRDYHKSYYRPDNFCVIVTGQVPWLGLLKACAPTVASIKKSHFKGLPAMERPFSSAVPGVSQQQEVRMTFPAEDESTGAICELCWHGPGWSDLENVVALKVLLAYLCEDSISPLRKALVETVPPLCGKISEGLHEYKTQLINITLKSCDVEQLQKRDVTSEVQAVFKCTAKAEGIDLPRLKSVIRQKQRQHLSAVESNPHDLFSGEIIGAFLYAEEFASTSASGASGASVKARLDAPATLEKLLSWSEEKWATLCQCFLCAPGVTVVGCPSKATGEEIQAEDAARLEQQKKTLGEEGMKKAGEELAAAEDENEVETPEEVSAQFQVPDVSRVQLIDVSTVTVKNGVPSAVFGKDSTRLKEVVAKAAALGMPGLNFHFDHVAGAQFISCHLMVPLTSLTMRQLELMPLWCDTAFELPMVSSPLGEALSHEAVVQLLTDTVVHRSFNVGVGGGRFRAGAAANMLHISMKVERAQYEKAPWLIARLLADVEFSVDRLQVALKRMLNDVPNSKRNGKGLMRLAMSAFDYSDSCAHGAFNVFRVEKLLKGLEDAGNAAPLGACASELAGVRTALLAPGALAYVSGDIAALETGIFKPWCHQPFMAAGGGGYKSAPATPLPALRRELYAADALRPPEGSTYGCFLSSTAEEHRSTRVGDGGRRVVAIEYITALEGPFWRKIRGKGHAYSYGINHDLEAGKLTFSLYKVQTLNKPLAQENAFR
ncbi:Uncharacterized protein C05D11.1 [Durusdinium trenchii]|uniref:Uncharacterized protein C05D11.1 n=1 Tax=Durusdinium trenchii TaxID=1381693 RepID=A0ABP0K6B2_9DINO